MIASRKLLIEQLRNSHKKQEFQCGIDALDVYLKQQAGQDIKRRISRAFVAVDPDRPSDILGYYTLSALSINLTDLPENLARKLPRHPVPAALIGRLAVSHKAQKQGIGKMLLADAISRTLAVGDQIAIYTMVVDAINDHARRFYEQFGFIPIGNDSNRLFLPLRSLSDKN